MKYRDSLVLQFLSHLHPVFPSTSQAHTVQYKSTDKYILLAEKKKNSKNARKISIVHILHKFLNIMYGWPGLAWHVIVCMCFSLFHSFDWVGVANGFDVVVVRLYLLAQKRIPSKEYYIPYSVSLRFIMYNITFIFYFFYKFLCIPFKNISEPTQIQTILVVFILCFDTFSRCAFKSEKG